MSQAGNIQFNSEKLRKGIKPIIAIKFDTYTGASHLYYASKTITLDGNSYEMRCKSLPNINRSIRYEGGLSSIGNVSVTIINQDKESDFLRTVGMGFIMGNALVALVFNDGTTPLWAERLELFTGKLDDLKNISEDGLTFDIFDNDKTIEKIIGEKITSAYSNYIPTESIGKVKSNVYGILLSQCPILHGGTEAVIPTNFNFPNIGYLKGVLYSNTDTDFEYFISKNEMNELTTSDIWLYDKRLNRFIHVLNNYVTISNPDVNGNCTVKLSLIAGVFKYFDYWFGKGSGTGSADWNNIGNACDKNIDTYADITEDIVDWFDESMNLNFDDYDDSDVVDGDIQGGHGIFARAHVITGDAADITFTINAQNMDTEDGTKIKQAGTLGATVATINDDVVVRVIQDNNTDIEIKVYEIYKRIYLERSGFDLSRFDLYISCKGNEYGAWINGRSTNETDPNTGAAFTVNHPDDDGSGDLIENPVGVIESVCRDLIGLNPEHLNENDFATHVKWDVIGQVSDAGGRATFEFAGGSLNGNLTQTAANRLLTGENGKSYVLRYTCVVVDVPNGDFALTITNAFADSAITLPVTMGIHYIRFTSNANASTADFVIDASETTATIGLFLLDDIYLERNDLELDSFNIAANARSTWKFAFAITEQTDATELLDRLVYEASCWLFWNYANRLEILAFDETADFTESGSATAISEDIFIHQPEIIALDFNDTTNTSRIEFSPVSEHQITGDMTFECWIYFNDFASGHQVILCCEGPNANEASNRLFYLYKVDASNTVFHFSQEHGANIIEHEALTLDNGLTAQTWYHLSLIRIYPGLSLIIRDINGVTIATATATLGDGVCTGGGDSYLVLGQFESGHSSLDGKMKEARLWNTFRLADETIANLYKILTGNEANLVGYWRIDEGALTTVYDITTYGNNGTIGAGCSWSTGTTYPDLGYYAQHPIIEDSFKIMLLPTSGLANDLTVNYYKNEQSGEFQSISNASDATSKAKYGTHEFQENLKHIADQTTAESLRNDLLYKKKEKWFKCEFRTWTNAANKSEGDIINIRHPILDNGIFINANMNNRRWQILEIEHDMNSQEITITAIILAIP